MKNADKRQEVRMILDGGTLEERISEAKAFLGLEEHQSFQELGGDESDEYDDKAIIICDDREVPVSERIKGMSKEEREKEFLKKYGKYLGDDGTNI